LSLVKESFWYIVIYLGQGDKTILEHFCGCLDYSAELNWLGWIELNWCDILFAGCLYSQILLTKSQQDLCFLPSFSI
jgi:predicted nucleic acid-binding Zn finger protein